MTNMQMLVNSINKANKESMVIVKAGNPFKKESYIVISEENAYNINVQDNKVVGCDCPHHVYRKAICKHMIKVSLTKNLDIANI